jgi:hypothetical protein
MRRALTCRAGLLAASLAWLVAPVQAQGTTSHATSAFTITGGVGGVFAGSQDGVDRNTGWRAGSAILRVEARWMTLATTHTTTMVPIILSVAIPLHR